MELLQNLVETMMKYFNKLVSYNCPEKKKKKTIEKTMSLNSFIMLSVKLTEIAFVMY